MTTTLQHDTQTRDQLIADARRNAAAGRPRVAAAGYARALSEAQPAEAALLDEYIRLLMALGTIEDARPLLERAVADGAEDVKTLFHLALACFSAGDFESAQATLDRVLAESPALAPALAMRCDMLATEGRFDDAAAILVPLIDSGSTDARILSGYARIAHRIGRTEDAIGRVQRAVEAPNLGAPFRIDLSFRLADLLDRDGQYALAWAAAERANALTAVRCDATQRTKQVDDLIAHWTMDRLQGLPRAQQVDDAVPQVVLIVGLPRSGTSLVESIFAAHPDVTPLGESRVVERWLQQLQDDEPRGELQLSAESVQRAAAALGAAYGSESDGAVSITDKRLSNSDHLGLLSLVIPNVRIIWCRRDPVDACLSCYFRHFRSGMEFSYDLQSLGRYSRDMDRLMQHWRSVLGDQVQECAYEELVCEPDVRIPRLIEFAGLPWDERCLAPHRAEAHTRTLSAEQVSEPIHRGAIGRWRNYEPWLGPLREALAE